MIYDVRSDNEPIQKKNIYSQFYKSGINLWNTPCPTLSKMSFSLSNTVSKCDAATLINRK